MQTAESNRVPKPPKIAPTAPSLSNINHAPPLRFDCCVFICVSFTGAHTETPLHWAASSNDVAVLDALLDAGADIEAPGAVIGGGTPLADAVAFGQWKAARRLVERGARTTLWQAAALGLMDRVEKHFAGDVPPPNEITHAFWSACHGGQRESAEYLLARGAALNWIGYDGLTPIDAARRSEAGWWRIVID